MKLKKIIALFLFMILLSTPLLSEGSSRYKQNLFDGKLYLTNIPLVGQKAILTLDLTAIAGDLGATTIIFRTPDGVSILGRSTFDEPLFIKGMSQRYSVEIEITEKGTYAIQASIYTQISRDHQEAEHFFTYIVAGNTYSHMAEKMDSLTISKKGIQVRSRLAPPNIAMAQGTLSFSGYIKYYDDNLRSIVPIKRVAVQLFEIFNINKLIGTAYTNDEGFYSFDNISNPNMDLRSFQLTIVFDNDIQNFVDDSNKIYKFDLPVIQNVSGSVINNDYILNETNQFRCLGHIFNTVIEAYDFLQEKLNWNRRKITTKWPYKDGDNSIYKYSYRLFSGDIINETINIAISREWERTTMLHEYGHSIMAALYNYDYNNIPKDDYKGESHTVNTISDTAFAIKEGWAEFCEALIDDNAHNLTQYSNANTPNVEYNSWWKGKEKNNTQGEIVEGAVASILWDIVDTDQSKDEFPNNDDDSIRGMLNELWNIMSNKKPKSIIEFWDYWQNNNYGQLESLRNIFVNNGVNVTIKPQNRSPIANAQTIIVSEDNEIDIVLTGNDEDSDPLTYKIAKMPSNGNLYGQLPNQKYRPKPNFFGSDSFDFVANDGKADSQSATVAITINKVNDAPIVKPILVITNEDTAINVTPAGTDVDNDPLIFKIINQPANGSLEGVSPNFIYTPKSNYNGNDSFTFVANDGESDSNTETATIIVNAVNDAPIPDPQLATIDEDTQINITLTATDADSDKLTYKIINKPSNGTLSGTPPEITYKPNPNFNGDDSFDFVVNDGKLESQPAKVSISVTSVNDLPVAIAQSIATDEDTAIKVVLTGTDGDELTFRIIDQPLNGTIDGTPSEITYKPKQDFNGDDGFSFIVNDGIVDSDSAKISVTVNPVNDPPAAIAQSLVTDEDAPIKIILTGTDVDGDELVFKIVDQALNGTIEGNPPEVTYKPNQNFNGNDGFSFIVNDGTVDSDSVKVSITVNPINDAPVAIAQSVGTDEDASIKIILTGTDVDGDELTFKIVDQALNGTIDGTPPELTYKPKQDFNGDDGFSFIVNDGTVDSDSAKVSITVNPINDLPVAIAQSVTTDEDAPIKIILTGTDVDGDNLIFKIVDQSLNGAVEGNPPEITYKPKQDFNGNDSFTFIVNDGTVESDLAKVSIQVNPVNDLPIAEAQSFAINENASVEITLSASDLDGDAIIFKIMTQPANGAISGSPPKIIYKPNYGFGGEDSFTFTANDGKSDCAPMIAKIIVNPIPNPVDINKDGIINILDFVIISKYYGKEDFPIDYNPDVNRDHKVDDRDFDIVKKSLGKKFDR